MTHASLFSGIGGAEIAAAWMGWTNLFHCDINKFGLQTLAYWFPESTEYNDITKTKFNQWRGRVDVLTGGFPCQPFSTVGLRKGAKDDRYLWPHMCRAIGEIEPRYVVGENVAGLLTMVESPKATHLGVQTNLFGANRDTYRVEWTFTLERICRDIENLGYAVQPLVIPAVAVGAPHRRDRLWILAKRRTSADTVVPYATRHEERIRRQQQGEHKECERHDVRPCGVCENELAAHADSERRKRRDDTSQQPLCKRESVQNNAHIPPRPDFKNFPTQSPLCGGDDGLSVGVVDSPVYRGSKRQWVVNALKALGNSWCPQVALEVFNAIQIDYDNENGNETETEN